MAGIVLFLLTLYGFGFEVAKRFVLPGLIEVIAWMGWSISRKIQEDGLSKIVHAGSVGLGIGGIFASAAAFGDAIFFTNQGYLSFGVVTMLFMWIAYHVSRAYRIIHRMRPEQLQHITQGTAIIVAQMTAVGRESERTLERYESAKQKLRLVG